MVSPFVELTRRNLRRKAFSFGIFRNRISSSGIGVALVNGNKPDRGSVMRCAEFDGRGHEGGRVTQMLFCDPGIAKVGGGSPNVRKARLYYDTSFSASVALLHPLAAKQPPSVRYVTDAGELLR